MPARLLQTAQLVWVIALAAYAAHYAGQRWDDFRAQEWRLDPLWFGVAAALALARRFFGGLRWGLLATLGRPDATFGEWRRHLRVYFLSNLATYLPGGVWYIPSRIQMSRRQGMSVAHTSLALVYEMGLLVWTGAAMGGYGLARSAGLPGQTAFFIFVGGMLLSLIVVYPRALMFATNQVRKILGRRPIETTVPAVWAAKLWGVSMGVWLCSGLSLFGLLRSLDPRVSAGSLGYVMSASAAAWTAGFLALWAPSGFGVREGVMGWLLAGTVATPIALVAVVVARILTLFEDVVWYVIAVLASGRLDRAGGGAGP